MRWSCGFWGGERLLTRHEPRTNQRVGMGQTWLCAAFVLALPALAQAAGLTVAWNANPEPDVASYAVFYRTASGAAQRVEASTTQVRIENLQAGTRYYVSVVAINIYGLESSPSSEVNGLATDPAAPPTPPAGAVQTYFAEGASGFFGYRMALLNTTTAATDVVVTYLREGGTPVYRTYSLAAQSRGTVLGSDVPELDGVSFAAVVAAVPGVIAERTMRWHLNGSDGAHTAKALATPGTQWFLAEGNAGFFDTFVLLANPGTVNATATVDFLLDGGGLVRRVYTLSPNQRFTIWTNQIPELSLQSFATTVRSDRPILVERAIYFTGPHGAYEGGHASAAVPAGARNWFLAEGSTGVLFENFVLLANPNSSSVSATIQYLTPAGVARTETRTLPGNSRTTIQVDALPGLGATDYSCSITSTGDIIAERSMYWSLGGPWYGGHNSVGITALRTRWALAEGEVGGADGADSFVLLANPGTTAATVTLSFLRTSGTPIQVTRTVPARSRVTVAASSVSGLANGERFGVIVDSNRAIAVERSMYWNYEGALWSSGTNETGTPLQ